MAIEIVVPGWRDLRLARLVLDYNGTLAVDGRLAEGVAQTLRILSGSIEVHVLTADTFGSARRELAGLDCRVTVLAAGEQHRQKADYVARLGAESVVAIGNGRNDREMLARAALAIAVIGAEGAAAEALAAAHVVVTNPRAALELLLHPQRLVATLRS